MLWLFHGQHEISEDNSVQWTRVPENDTHSCPSDSVAEERLGPKDPGGPAPETLELVPCPYILLEE